MIKILKCSEVTPEEIFARSVPTVDVAGIVADIIADVRKYGDKTTPRSLTRLGLKALR